MKKVQCDWLHSNKRMFKTCRCICIFLHLIFFFKLVALSSSVHLQSIHPRTHHHYRGCLPLKASSQRKCAHNVLLWIMTICVGCLLSRTKERDPPTISIWNSEVQLFLNEPGSSGWINIFIKRPRIYAEQHLKIPTIILTEKRRGADFFNGWL